jgi:hypothetical protein
MDDYYFLYKDSEGKWKTATNPIFIAKHTYCRAIPKKDIRKIGRFSTIYDLIHKLNSTEENKDDIKNLISKYELY